MSDRSTVDEQFSRLDLSLKEMNLTSMATNVADGIQSYENPPSLHFLKK